jgi:hypothetical protein
MMSSKKREDAQDESGAILEQSNAGKHMSSKYVQSHNEKINREIESLHDTLEKIKHESEHRK